MARSQLWLARAVEEEGGGGARALAKRVREEALGTAREIGLTDRVVRTAGMAS